MIQFSLRCENGHDFDSWFKSTDAFEKLVSAGMLTCAVCGTSNMKKAPMAPRVTAGRRDDDAAPRDGARSRGTLATPDGPAQQALAELRRRIEAHSDDVGRDFAHQARAMHDGVTPARPIHGEASHDEARALAEDGVPVLPLPFKPKQKLQ